MEQARTLADTGDFQKASEVAAALGDSEGLAFAAASLAVFAYEIAEESDSQKLFLMAIRYAEMAVELDPTSSEAYLQLAHTLGRYAQTLGTLTALSEGYAEQIRAAIDTAIELDPKNYKAYLSPYLIAKFAPIIWDIPFKNYVTVFFSAVKNPYSLTSFQNHFWIIPFFKVSIV